VRSAEGLPWVALEGPSGVGKSTLVRSLIRATGRSGLAEAVDGAVDPPSLRFRTRAELLRIERRLVELERERYREAVRRRRSGELLVLDTGFLGPLTYSWGVVQLRGASWSVVEDVRRRLIAALELGDWGLPDLTVYLDAPDAVVDARARSAALGHPPDLRERHARVGAFERPLWTGTIATVAPGRVVAVSAIGSVTTVTRRIVEVMRRAPLRARPSHNEAAAVLALFRSGSRRSRRPASLATVKSRASSPRPLRR
jgi:thymidylate kinase